LKTSCVRCVPVSLLNQEVIDEYKGISKYDRPELACSEKRGDEEEWLANDCAYR